ncbi:SAM-dependent methyltransferase [candidate division WWE3 bacterium]|nr:SAM-dependent methyltransferase [candidate division WWE3 bacterium]
MVLFPLPIGECLDLEIPPQNFVELPKRKNYAINSEIKSYLEKERMLCLISEAGNPCIADPGNNIVSYAHRNNFEVIPLVGPSSILLTLSASGLNGQNFEFTGYAPIKRTQRNIFFKKAEKTILESKKTIIFMDTPYRSTNLMTYLLESVAGNLRLTIGNELFTKQQFIATKEVKDWKKLLQRKNISLERAIFCLGAPEKR